MNYKEFLNKFQKKEVIVHQDIAEHQPMVSVCVQTYQHGNYIKECLDGILMQQTTFTFEILLGEDASTDGTREICLEYAQKHPDKIRLFLHHRENNIAINGTPTGRFNFLYNLYNARGNYIALCEGDDYWTDPLKLQKQVDFLEGNEGYTICWTNYKIDEMGTLKNPHWVEGFFKVSYKDIDFNNFGTPYCTYTLTCMFKSSLIKAVNIDNFKFFKDNTLYTLCLQKGKGAVLNFFGGVYRIHNTSIYSTASKYKQAISNYSNFAEILIKIPESRVENIKNKKRIWEREFFKELKKQPFSKFKKLLIRFKFYIHFKNA